MRIINKLIKVLGRNNEFISAKLRFEKEKSESKAKIPVPKQD